MKAMPVLFAITITAAMTGAVAQGKPPSVHPIAATFMEAPPGRDKSVAPVGAGDSLEKVEVQAVFDFADRLVVDKVFFFDKPNIVARAELADGKSVALGTAQVGSFRKASNDGHKMLVSFAIVRLPDKPVARVIFEGPLEFTLARGTTKRAAPFDGKAGSPLDAGLGKLTVSEVSTSAITLKGGEALTSVSQINLIRPDGSSVSGERGSYSQTGGGSVAGAVELGWRFKAPVGPGRLEFVVYEGIETRTVPVKLVVKRPL